MSLHRAFAWLRLCAASVAGAASFPCEKAATAVEKRVCSDERVSELDGYLGRYYAAAQSTLGHATACLAADQRLWLRRSRDVCEDATCLQAAYLSRLAELHGVQPGASALKNLALPAEPALVGILPPAKDQAAAPRSSGLEPLVVRGRLVNEVAAGDGYVVLAENGRKHLVAALMFLDDSTAALEWLSKEASAVYLVKGGAEPGDSTGRAFSPASCRYIYRVQ